MSTNVTMPSMGFDMTEGKVSRWINKVGDAVERGQVIGEIETEKATVDLEAPVAGTLAQILVQVGETVPVSMPIAVITAAGESVSAPASPAPTEAKKESPPPAVPAQAQPHASVASVAPTVSTNGERIKVSPLAKNIARAEGIDLAALHGTGPNGRIIERDVKAFLQTRAPSAPPSTSPAQAAPMPKPSPAAVLTTAPASTSPAQTPAQLVAGEQPLSKMRQVIARRLQESKSTIPHFYLTIEIFMDEAMKLRAQLNALAASDAEKLSVNDLIVAACARTLQKFPAVNAYFKGDTLELHDVINVGIAVSVDDGLLTPVLHNADKKSLKQIAIETKELAARARANKMKPDDLGPGTFTVSNLGMYGIDEFSAIINPPESSILAVGAVKKVPVVINDQIQIAQVMKATLSVDHRIVDGALGAKYLQELKKLLENPVNLLLAY